MKYILCIIFFLSSLFSVGQSNMYHPFPDSNATWCVESFSGDGGTYCNYTNSIYRLSGDTMMNGMLYSRMLHYELTERWYCPMGQPPHIYFWVDDNTTYFIRQDTIQKKVWLWYSHTGRDTIMYDFNLQVGDTLSTANVYWGNQCNDCVVSSIDSMLVGLDFRRRINFQSNCFGFGTVDTSIVEGIGGLHSLFYGPSCFEGETSLREFSLDNTLLYSTPYSHFANCQTILSVPVIEAHSKSTIFPNPFHESGTLEIPGYFGLVNQLKIYNSTGMMIREARMDGHSLNISRNELGNGIYFYQLVNEEGVGLSGKFVVE